ncbi:c-type cytochrome [Comamonadaceae bacterium OTU4NAUVB1]|jgi:cytochrome c553|nr:c-type cytochrome [Comamonadaceae bacterium OTU4NAUVB1]HSU23752.1 c-type cytochrome [Variovorax sp.]
MNRHVVAWTVALAAMAMAPAAPAASAVAGKAKAAACAACHGPLGKATMPDAPNLAGQPAMYVAEQLKAYRSGARKHEVMSLMAKPLKDADIDDLAAWFASIQVQVQAP